MEHIFGKIKHQFGYQKVHYKDLAKNSQAMFIKFSLANIVIARRHLMVNYRDYCSMKTVYSIVK